jgi:hypothetical protein
VFCRRIVNAINYKRSRPPLAQAPFADLAVATGAMAPEEKAARTRTSTPRGNQGLNVDRFAHRSWFDVGPTLSSAARLHRFRRPRPLQLIVEPKPLRG